MPVPFFRTLLRPGAWQKGAFLSLLAPLAIGADDSADWRFELSPYAWVAGLKGEVGTLPGAPAAPIDVAPSDVIDNLDAVLMLIFNTGGGAVGGFGVGSDSFYELSGAIGYRWSDAIATAVGYRRYEVDYRDSGFSYDVTQQGWQFGLTWAF